MDVLHGTHTGKPRHRRRTRPPWPRRGRQPGSSSRRPLQTYLVVFDGEDWAEVVPMRARSLSEIASDYPEATVLVRRPAWMSAQEYARLMGSPHEHAYTSL